MTNNPDKMEEQKPITGGEFLIRDVKPEEVFIPDEWSEEQKMMEQMCVDFVNQEIVPHLDRIDSMEDGLMESIVTKAGAQGLLGISVPE
jgi:alkylation response protein AidB-like acyl-CoA dehydrogenase